MKEAERAIVVLGMSHAATTVTAFVLNTHSKMRLIVSGEHAEVLECDFLINRNWQMIRYLLQCFSDQYLVFKHPWAQENMSFFAKHMRKATYLYCLRDYEDVCRSWQQHRGPTPYGPMSIARDVYDLHVELAEWFPKVVQPRGFMCIQHDEIVNAPQVVFGKIAKALRLKPTFDFSIIEPEAHWNRHLKVVPHLEIA